MQLLKITQINSKRNSAINGNAVILNKTDRFASDHRVIVKITRKHNLESDLPGHSLDIMKASGVGEDREQYT